MLSRSLINYDVKQIDNQLSILKRFINNMKNFIDGKDCIYNLQMYE